MPDVSTVTPEARARRNVEALHEGLVEWFRGACESTDAAFDARIGRYLGAGFSLVSPSGQRKTREGVVDGLRAAHGASPELTISITDFSIVCATADVLVATCTEWQRGARHSAPDNARVLTVVMVPDTTAPEGLSWVHLHETWASDASAQAQDDS